MSSNDHVLRPLSIQEASFPLYAKLSPGAGNIVAAVTLATELAPERARLAVRRLHNSEAMLRASYVYLPAENTYVFVDVHGEEPGLEYEQVDSAELLLRAVEAARVRLLNRSFVPGRLLYRGALISAPGRSTLMVCASHSMTDSKSVEMILRGWLQGIEQSADERLEQMPIPPSLLESMPATLAAPTGLLRSLGVLLPLLRFQKLADRGQSFRIEHPAASESHRCLAASRRLSPESTSTLLARVKERNLNLHGYISAAYLMAFLVDCQHRQALSMQSGVLCVPLVTTVDVRRHSPEIGGQTLGCLSSGITTPIQVPVEALTDGNAALEKLAPVIAERVKTALARNEHWKILRIYSLLGYEGLRKMFIDTSEKPMATPVSFANMGNLDISFTKLPIVYFEFYGAFHVSGPGLSVSANTCNGIMTLGMTGPAPLMSQATLEKYADRVMQLLQVEAFIET